MLTSSVASAVRSAGGWLFDQGMAGWDVAVLTSDRDPRSLRILGARPIDPSATAPLSLGGPWPQALAVDAGLHESNEQVRRLVREAVDSGVTDVRLWDATAAGGAGRGSSAIQHRLSLAAMAFKTHALAAVDEPVDAVGATESFRSGQFAPPPRLPDPVPAA